MNANAMTAKQESFLLALCNQATGQQHRYLSQHRDLLGISSTGMQRITKAEASALINKMKVKAGR